MPTENRDSFSIQQAHTDGSRYVAYCDILGFSSRILKDFDKTLTAYREFGDLVSRNEFPVAEVQVSMYSDAILLTGVALPRILSAVQSIWFFALAHDLMIRGAITHGRYWEERRKNHLLVVSDALVRAVKLEHSVGVPAVVIADDVEIPDKYWLNRFAHGPLGTPLLHFRDRNIVNPFNQFWFRSAFMRASQLMTESPAHRDKYLWFLALHKAVSDDRELVPSHVLARFVREGIVKRNEPPPRT
jgi:hypothetical protein